MRTLLERLKPEHRARLESQKEEYMFTHEHLVEMLARNVEWKDMPYRTIDYLLNTLKIYDYSPYVISKLFEHE